jgi:hypothetical protein
MQMELVLASPMIGRLKQLQPHVGGDVFRKSQEVDFE